MKIGRVENICINGHRTIARIDTGATSSSIDQDLAARLGLSPVSQKKVKSASGINIRDVVEAELNIGSKTIINRFTVADRSGLSYPVLIGLDILKNGFIIDPSKRFLLEY